MSESSPPPRNLSGIARSIRDLFDDDDSGVGAGGTRADDPAPAAEAPRQVSEDGSVADLRGLEVEVEEDVAWVAESGARLEPTPASPPPAPLKRAVAEWLRADPADRPARREVLDEAFAEARAESEDADTADAILELGRAGLRDDASLETARELLTLQSAKALAQRLAGSASDERTRADLISVIIRLGPTMAQGLAKVLDAADDLAARRVLIDAIVEMEDDAREVVERMADDTRWYVVRNAVVILGRIGGESSIEHLTGTLAAEDPRVRRETVTALGKIGGEDAGILVSGKLQDTDPDVRAAAARAVGALQVERALRPLLQMLDDESDEDVLVEVCRALGSLGDPSAVNGLEKRAVGGFFSRSSTELRVAAYQGIGGIRTPRAKHLLEDALEDRDPAVRNVARSLLKAREG